MNMEKNEEELNNLKKEFDALKNSIKKIAQNNSSELSYDNLKDAANRISDKLEGFFSNKTKTVQEHPLACILGAVVAGALIGALIKK